MKKNNIIAAAMLLASLLPASAAKPKSAEYSPGMKPVDITMLKPIRKSANMECNAIYADPQANAAERTADLIRRLTFDEKLALTGGWNRFLVAGVERLGIRPVSMADASQGIRLQTTLVKDKSLSFPGMLPLASTWNKDLAREMGQSIAVECRALGVDILLGPGVNIQRLSVGGRSFEYMGEDPLLTASMATEYVAGLQSRGIIATPKHFVGNDQDFCRHITSCQIDERTLREVYLLPWEWMIKRAGCLGIMTGNNLVNGIPCPMHRELLTKILRDEFGFKGLAMTDWQNTNYYPSQQQLVLTSGETLLMPENTAFKTYLLPEFESSPERKAEVEVMLEKMIYPTLYALFTSGVYDRNFNEPELFDEFESHKQLASEIAGEAIVMLKNDRAILPVAKGKKILLTGEPELHSGTGSGFVAGYDHVSYEAGLRRVYGGDLMCDENPDPVTVRQADVVLFRLNKPAGEGHDIPFEEPVDQLQKLREVARLNKNVIVLVNACNTMPTDWIASVRGVLWCYFLGQERGTALAAIVSGEICPSGKLPFTIERAFADSPDSDYNYIGGKPFWQGNNEYKTYWLDNKPVEVAGFSDFVQPGEVLTMPYLEGVFVGYRWYDKKNTPVVYPFGAGLSYARFEYENIACENRMETDGKVVVRVNVKNTGRVTGREVVQVYVSDSESTVERPEKELKAFEKVELKPGLSMVVELELDRRSFSYWDVLSHDWKLEPGEFVVRAGGSSASLPLNYHLNL